MATILLKNLTDKVNIIKQQNAVVTYAKRHKIPIDIIEIETSDFSKPLEQRDELRGFLRSLNPNSTLLIYDFWVLSAHVGELVKLLECMLERNIDLHVINKKVFIDVKIKAYDLLSILTRERAVVVEPKEQTKQGRPKGRMSQSKFDKYRAEIISHLEKNTSISQIAKELGVSRTSLKDYVNSRNLKSLAVIKKDLLGSKPQKVKLASKAKQECDLIATDKD